MLKVLQCSVPQIKSLPRGHDTSIDNLANHVLAHLLLDAEALQAAVHQQDITHADIVDEAVVVNTDPAILAVGPLCHRKCVCLACKRGVVGSDKMKDCSA